ncbi:MAG: hypothetical protein R3F61_32410 [Myxococcota bacterium]
MIALLLACALPPQVEAASVAANPMLTLDRTIDRTPIDGIAREVRSAGGYEYVALGDRWVVGLAKGIAPGDAVRAAPVGVAHDFHSSRTGDSYDSLWFSVLSKRTP